MKCINAVIDVREATDRTRRPLLFRWAGRTYHVLRVLDVWRIQSDWWAVEERRTYYHVHAHAGKRTHGTFVLYKRQRFQARQPCADAEWILEALDD